MNIATIVKAIALGSAALLASCVGLEQYRTEDSPGSDKSFHELLGGHSGSATDLYVVEIDDQGWLMDQRQLNAATQALDNFDGCGNSPLVITFVHGWNHNAKYGDQNLEDIRESLKLIAKAVPKRKVVGVFVGWRGMSGWRGPGLLSFWSRKEAAHRIGYSGAAEVFNRLELSKAKLVDEWNAGGGNSKCINLKPQLFVLGHSFGSAVTFSAYGQILGERMRVLASMPNAGARAKLQERWADLVVLLNPAFEAARTEHLMRIPADCTHRPGGECEKMLMILTARTDSATKIWFRAGRWLGTLTESFWYNKKAAVPQGAANRTAAGHFESWLTHSVSLSRDKKRASWCLEEKDLKEPLKARGATPSPLPGAKDFCGFSVASLAGSKALNPRFANIRLEADIGDGHGLAANRESMSEFLWDYVMLEAYAQQDKGAKPPHLF